MSNLFKYTKRVLTSVLAAAVVLTAIPSTAFGADNFDENIDLVETVETVEEAQEQEIAEQAEEEIPADNEEAVVEENDALDAEAASEGEIFAEGEEEGPDADAVSRELIIADPDNTADATASRALLAGLTYGTEFDPIVIKSRATIGGVTADYDKVTWSVLKCIDNDITDPNVKYADANLTDATADLTALGIKWATSGTGNTGLNLSFSGDPAPKKYEVGKNLVIRTVGTENTENRKVLPVTLVINPATVTTAGGTITFRSDKMGYEVLDKTPSPAPETPYTVAQKTTLTTTAMQAYKITDLTYELSGDDASAFEVVAPTGADAELYSGHPVTLVVKPKTGLSALGDYDADGEYVATLTAKSASLVPAGEIVTDLSFTVTSNLEFASATKNGGTALTKAELAAATADLGEIKVGETFKQTVVTATGGNGKITITKGGTAFPKNIIGTASNTANTATYTISGQVPTVQADGTTSTIGTYGFTLALSDEEGNSEGPKNFQFEVKSADLGLSIDDEDFDLGANAYDWNAASGYTPSSEAKTVKLVNNSPIELTINAALSGLQKGGAPYTSAFTLSSGASEMVIPAGGIKTFTITPGPAQNVVDPVPSYTGTLTLSGKGITATPIALTFTENGTDVDFDITKPAADTDPITGGFVGRDYSFKFGYTKDEDTSVPAWTIDGSSATSATTLKDTYGLELNKTTGELKGVPKAFTPTTPGYIAITVRATYTQANGTSAHKEREVRLTIAKPKDAFTLASGGTTLDQKHGLDLGAKKTDEQVKTEFTIHNNTKADIGGVFASVSATNKDESDVSSKFHIIYSDDPAMQTYYNSNGLTIKAGESATVRVDSDATMPADKKYTATVTVTSTNVQGPSLPLTAYAFSETFSVTDVPVINATAVTGTGKFTAGTDIAVETLKYTATLAGATLPVFLYSWEPADTTSQFNILNSGLTLREDGVVVGKPKKAGVYKVKVTVTEQNSGSVGTLTHDLTVDGTVALTANLSDGTDVDGKAVALPGVFAGEAAKQTLQFYTQPDAVTKNVTITVEDADDDRSSAEKAANPKNPYKGSAEFIEASPSSFASVGADEQARFYLKTKGNPEAGAYKVKVTITSDEAGAATTFSAHLNVVDKLTIDVPATATANIAEEKIINLSADGGFDGQAITWSEVGTKEKPSDVTKKYYVTTGGIAGTAGETGLALTGDGINGYAAAIGGTTYGNKGVPTKAGSFSVKLKASATGATMPVYDPITAPKGYRDGADLVYNDANALPAQDSDEATLALTIGKTNKVAVGKAGNLIAVDTSNDSNNDAGIQGTKLGSSFSEYTGYVFKSKMSATEAGNVEVTVTNFADATVNVAAVKLEKEASSDFTITPSEVFPADIASNGTFTITVAPKTTLTTKKTYTDKILIKGDNMETVSFNLSFTLEDGKYEATVTNQTIVPEPTTDPEELAKLKYYVTKNVLGKDPIALTDAIEKKGAPAAEKFWVKNEGNTAFYKAKVEEVKANGTPYADGETRLLTIADPMAAAGGVTILPDADDTFTLRIANTDTAGTYNAKLRLTFAESAAVGATTKTIDIPVTYTVYNKTVKKLTVTPSSIDFGSAAEGYTPDSLAKTFTIKNTGTATVDTISALRVHVDEDEFVISSNTEGVELTDNQTLTLDKLAPGASATFTIKPVKELSAKTWTANLGITSANTPATAGEVKFVVTKSSKLNLDVFKNERIVDQSVAERLYNTLVIGKQITGSGSTVLTQDYYTVDVNLYPDSDATKDITIVFAVDDKTDINAVYEATIATKSGYNVKESSNKVTLTADEEKDAKGANAIGAKGYYTEATFNLYDEAVFVVDPLHATNKVFFTDDALDLFGAENTRFYSTSGTPVNHGTNTTLLTAKPADTTTLGVIEVDVKVGEKVGSAFAGAKLPEAWTADQPFGNWKVNGTTNKVDKDTKIAVAKADIIVPTWHTHALPDEDEKDESLVKWAWEGSASTGYTDATLTLHCKNTCPNEDKGELVIASDAKRSTPLDKRWEAFNQLVIITTQTKDGDCTHGSRTEYTATAIVGANTYTSTKIADEDPSTKVGHKYNTTITWRKQDDGSYKPEITQKCIVCSTETENHDFTATVFTVDKKVDKEPTCTEKGKTTYTLTSFTDGNGKVQSASDVKKLANYSFEATTDALGHKPEFEFSDVDTEKLTAKAVVKCSVCHEELYNGPVKLKDNGDGSYAVEVTGKDGNKYTGEYVDHVHEWVATWAEWKRTDPTDKFSWSTSLTLTCNKGKKPETRTPEVTVTKTTDDKYVDYVATATYAGQTYTSDVFTVDAETGEPTAKHEHKWTLTNWYWEGPAGAIATFTCSVGKETKKVTGTPVFQRENARGDKLYLVQVVGPDSKTYSDTQWYDKNGNPTSGEGIGIEGIEDEYEYTGKPIKPEPIVRDYATDAILVKGTDYSVKYENNKKVGSTATITVTGKGNYGEKGGTATATFTIVDPTKDEKPEDYFTIKSVKVTSKDGFAYDGTEKFPATLTIKTSEGDVAATWDGSSYNLNVDSTKEMHINVSNNVNKGSGIVAVTGNDGKGKFVTKSATFSIKARELVSGDENLTITADPAVWAVKGAKAKVEVTYNSETLVEGRDYTLAWSYTNKKNAGTGAGKVTVKGKGNFTKKAEQTFDITPFQIDKVDSVAAYAGLKASGIKVTMYDGEGSVIPAKNYTATFEVFSKEGLEISDAKYKLQAGDKINVTVKAANSNLDGEETLADIVVGANLAKAKITVPKSFTKTFTGEAIELDSSDFESGKINVGGYTYGEDFIITGYQNNVKKGTMTVFIQGVSDKVSGVSKFKVKIVPKKVTPAK